jgi:hypothetical protein
MRYRRNSDARLRGLERQAATGDMVAIVRYTREAMRLDANIPILRNVQKQHQRFIRAIENFPMARTDDNRMRLTKRPAVDEPDEMREYLLPAEGDHRLNINKAIFGDTPIVNLMDSLHGILIRARPLWEEHEGIWICNYENIEKAAAGLILAATELRLVFADERDAIWNRGINLLTTVINLVYNIHIPADEDWVIHQRPVEYLEAQLGKFRNVRSISKSRISRITGRISELATTAVHPPAPLGGQGPPAQEAYRDQLRAFNTEWSYIVVPGMTIVAVYS